MDSHDRPAQPLEADTASASGADGARAAEAPRTVIRGESPSGWAAYRPDLAPVRVLTDWVNITFPFSETAGSLDGFIKTVSLATDGALGGMEDRECGLHGWQHSFRFDRGGAMFAYGGQRATAFLSLPGEACALVPDWNRFVELGQKVLAGRITRWDGAVDDFAGLHSVDLAVELYRQGGFNCQGRMPHYEMVGPWLPDADRGTGRTFYVGKRESGKVLRVYEKGKQLGAQGMPWVRWELELHNVDRVVPWDVLLRPNEYVSGSYPCMKWVGDIRSRIQTIRAQDSISYSRLKEVASVAYGRLIHVMLEREGSAERVIDLLRRAGAPKRLAFTDEYLKERSDGPGV